MIYNQISMAIKSFGRCSMLNPQVFNGLKRLQTPHKEQGLMTPGLSPIWHLFFTRPYRVLIKTVVHYKEIWYHLGQTKDCRI